MTLEDECKHLMYCRDKLKEYKKGEEEAKNRIITYLKNHSQAGVSFRHNNKNVTLMVESTCVKKNISRKEKEKKVQDILINIGVKNADDTTQEIIKELRQITLTNQPNKDKLRCKMTKK